MLDSLKDNIGKVEQAITLYENKGTISAAEKLSKSIQELNHSANSFFRNLTDENSNPIRLDKTDEELTNQVFVNVNIEQTTITLDFRLLNRSSKVYNYLLDYTEVIYEKLRDGIKKNGITPYEYAEVIYEHKYPLDYKDRGFQIYDTDNYNQNEAKKILDTIVSSGLVLCDEGLHIPVITNKTYLDETIEHPETTIIIRRISD